MSRIFEILLIVFLVWFVLSVGFAFFWSILKRREPTVEEAEDALASDN